MANLVNFTKSPNFTHQTFCNCTNIISVLMFLPNIILTNIFIFFPNFSLAKVLSYTVCIYVNIFSTSNQVINLTCNHYTYVYFCLEDTKRFLTLTTLYCVYSLYSWMMLCIFTVTLCCIYKLSYLNLIKYLTGHVTIIFNTLA